MKKHYNNFGSLYQALVINVNDNFSKRDNPVYETELDLYIAKCEANKNKKNSK